jgi:cobalamin biosynthesis protein CbiG
MRETEEDGHQPTPDHERATGDDWSDDPTGGQRLSRRLAVAVPIALAVGVAIGVPIAVWTGSFSLLAVIAVGLAAVVGFVVAAIEDGRVQRRVDRLGRRRSRRGTH